METVLKIQACQFMTYFTSVIQEQSHDFKIEGNHIRWPCFLAHVQEANRRMDFPYTIPQLHKLTVSLTSFVFATQDVGPNKNICSDLAESLQSLKRDGMFDEDRISEIFDETDS